MKIPFLFLLFLAYPMAEIATFILVGREFGVLGTLALLIGAGLVGIQLLRWQSFSLVTRVKADIDRGELPADQVLHGMLMALAGLFLLLPGFLSDILAFALLVPAVRNVFIRLMRSRMTVVSTTRGPAGRAPGVIDLDDDDFADISPPGGDPSPWRPGEPPRLDSR